MQRQGKESKDSKDKETKVQQKKEKAMYSAEKPTVVEVKTEAPRSSLRLFEYRSSKTDEIKHIYSSNPLPGWNLMRLYADPKSKTSETAYTEFKYSSSPVTGWDLMTEEQEKAVQNSPVRFK